jgi:hypothetical protein
VLVEREDAECVDLLEEFSCLGVGSVGSHTTVCGAEGISVDPWVRGSATPTVVGGEEGTDVAAAPGSSGDARTGV